MDFFSLMFEEWLTKVTQPFESIGNPVLKAVLQIVAMILCCAATVVLIFGIDPLISFVCNQIPFANNRIARIAIRVIAFVLCLVLIALFVRLVSWIVSFFLP